MTDPKPDYGLEPQSSGTGSGAPAPGASGADHAPHGAPPPLEPIPIEVEPDFPKATHVGKPVLTTSGEAKATPDGPSYVHSLDVCPNCGEPMRGRDTLVCLRCGFDLKTMKVLKTVTPETAPKKPSKRADTEEEEDTDSENAEPLVKPGMGQFWLPLALAAVSGVILLVGYLAGVHGLFHATDAGGAAGAAAGAGMGAAETVQPTFSASETIKPTVRFEGLMRAIVLIGMWVGCGGIALGFLAYLQGQKFGDPKLAAARLLGIVTTMRLVSLMHFNAQWLEWTIEAVLQAAAFTGLSMLLFSLKPRDLPTYAGATVIAFMFMWLGANVVVWVTG